MTTAQIQTNEFQTRVLALPEDFDLFMGGGRGGGKSYALALLALRYTEQYRERARVLYLRKTYAGLRDFELVTRELFATIYGTAASYNSTEHLWRLPTGGYFELQQLESYADLLKVQGRSFGLVLVDEAGQYADPALLDLIRANMRGPQGIPIRMAVAANPGGAGHHWIARRYVFRGAPWAEFAEQQSRRTWVYCPSTFAGNQFIDREQYREQLESSCPHDPELLRAWISGDWAVARGAYFASVLDESRNAIDPWETMPNTWDEFFLAHDFGSSAPSVTYVVARSPGGMSHGKWYPRGSVVLVDELATAKRDRPSEGLGWTVPVLAEEIRAMCKRWKIKPEGVADDSIFARTGSGAGSIAEEFRRAGVHLSPARKADRIGGWQMMRRMLADAGKRDVAGLYVSRGCEFFWSTVPYLPRDARRTEDVDSSAVDHAADAARYACLHQRRVAWQRPAY